MSLAFIPRKFAKAVKPPPPTHPLPSLSAHAPPTKPSHSEEPKHDVKGKGKLPEPNVSKDKEKEKDKKPKFTDESLSSLILLALSDYAIWSDTDLRRRVDPSSDSEGYVPLTYLIHHSPHLRNLPISDPHSQAQIIKSLRLHASDLIQIRLLVSQPSSSAWFGKGLQEKSGGYEVRRCDWSRYDLPSSTYSKAEWNKRTVYFENIPPAHRTVPGILSFATSLLPSLTLTSIQNIHLPTHHQDAPGDAPTCKGFAFITFSSLDDAQRMISSWPWDSSTPAQDEEDESKKEALKFGFRALSKSKWDALKEEYMAYRQQLVAEISEFQDNDSSSPTAPLPLHQTPQPEQQPTSTTSHEPTLSPNAPYPPNVLLFIKHLHAGTNKTTLRKLFSSAFKHAIERGEVENDGLDYVDYTKGMDSCHLRLITPTHARILLDHFTLRPTVQSSGLDKVGVSASGEKIEVELVQGKREEVYWEKVPERVRWAAVEKGIALQSQSQARSTSAAKRKRLEEDEHPPSQPRLDQQSQRTTSTSPYPYDCLLFVKHIHPETNKTTLRKLFARAFEGTADGLDYVDFSKGMDSCYLRLATPAHSSTLVSYFTKHSVFQTSGLDDTGSDTGGKGEKAIMMEMVQGKREVYWEKVPEKVRRAAVAKAIVSSNSFSSTSAPAAGEGGDEDGRGKKRRRKKGKSE